MFYNALLFIEVRLKVDFLKTDSMGTFATAWDIVDGAFFLKKVMFLKRGCSEKDYVFANNFSAVLP